MVFLFHVKLSGECTPECNFFFFLCSYVLDFTSVGSFGQDEVKYSSPSMYTLNPPPPPSTRPPPLLQSEQLNKSLPANLHNYYAAIDIVKVPGRNIHKNKLIFIYIYIIIVYRRSARSSISRPASSRA